MATTPRPRVEIVLLLVVAWLALCGLEWHVIAGAANETGDSAANSLLVQDAKSLVLLTGNYSRVGFNHPGPALLYMLAFGEWAFHDVLHVAPSPYGGQLIALALCNAGWIVAGFGVLRRIAGSASSAALMGSVFLVAATDSNAGMLASAWFPHLYILPFTVALLSLARLAAGRLDSVIALAVSAGVLINGHVAFPAILACLLLAAVAIDGAMAAGAGTAPLLRVVHPSERRRLLIAGGLFIAFLLPFGLETALHWPGPMADYARFNDAHVSHGLPDALDFVGLFWSDAATVAAALLAIALLRSWRMPDPWLNRWRPLVLVLLAATITVGLYAMFGIDLLTRSYLAWFYGAVPAWTLALCALRLWQWLPARIAGRVFWPAIALSLVATAIDSVPDAVDVAPPLTTAVEPFDRAAEALDGPAEAIFDLDPAARYATVWPLLAGVAVHARRDHRRPFCIDRGWHILFTRALRCDAATLTHARRYFVRAIDDPHTVDLTRVFAYGGVGVYLEPDAGATSSRVRPT